MEIKSNKNEYEFNEQTLSNYASKVREESYKPHPWLYIVKGAEKHLLEYLNKIEELNEKNT